MADLPNDNDLDQSELELVDDEPQFAAPNESGDKKKRGMAKFGNAVVPLFLVLSAVVIVAKFDYVKAALTGDKPVKAVQKTDTEPQPAMPDYQVTSPVEAAPVSLPVEKVQPANQSAPTQVGDTVNVVLANKIGELTDGLSVLTGHLVSVNSELQAIKDAQVKSDQAVLSGLQRIADGLEQIKVRDGQSEKVLAGVISDLRGFKQTLKEERLKFNLKILHVETYGGLPRIVGFEESSPQKVLKLYAGDDFGLWRVKLVTDSKAVFVHADGIEHTEVIR